MQLLKMAKNTNIKIIAITIFAAMACFLMNADFFTRQHKYGKTALAGIGDNVSGFAWSENIGWISFNCTDNSSCGTVDYGVNIDASGNFSGYAWSPNVGWIGFNQADIEDLTLYPGCGFPDTPCHSASYDSISGIVSGWAKILSMGDDGWIKMGDDSGIIPPNNYGVLIDSSTGYFSNFAWNANSNGSGIGWINFNCANAPDNCATSNYKVVLEVSPPAAPTIGLIEDLSCIGSQVPVRINWTDNSDNETNFEVEIGSWSGYCDRASDLSESSETGVQRNCTGGLISENTSYYFRVRAANAVGNSDWSPDASGKSHTTGFCPPVLTYDSSAANCDSIDLSWTYGDNDNVTEYEIWKDTNNSGSFTQIGSVSPPDPNVYTDTNIVSDYEYDYYIVAQPQNSTSNSINDAKPCPALPRWIEIKP